MIEIVLGVALLCVIGFGIYTLFCSFVIIPLKAKKMLIRLSKKDFKGVYTLKQQEEDREKAYDLNCKFNLEKTCRARGFLFYEVEPSRYESYATAIKSSYRFNGEHFTLDYAKHVLKEEKKNGMQKVRRKRKQQVSSKTGHRLPK